MTSLFKAQTESTLPLLSGENIVESEVLSEPSVGTDNTQKNTPTIPKSLQPTRSAATTGERIRQHADMARVVLRWLEKRGLVKRYKVLSKDQTRVIEIRLVLSPTIWTPDLDLVVLSDGRTTVAETSVEE